MDLDTYRPTEKKMEQSLITLKSNAGSILVFTRPQGAELAPQFSQVDTENLAQLPQPVSVNVSHISKDHQYGKSLLPQASDDYLDSIDISAFDDTLGNSLPVANIPDPLESILDNQQVGEVVQIQTQPCSVQVDMVKEFGAVEATQLIIDDTLPEGCTQANNNLNFDDTALEDAELAEFLGNGESGCVDFIPLEASKKKNPPYLISDQKITTKNNELVKFRLHGVKPCQTVLVSLRYLEEKYKANPVHPCRNHEKSDKEGFNFEVSPMKGKLDKKLECINEHPTTYFEVRESCLNLEGNFDFNVMFYCLNSCHKENGKKIKIILKLLEERNVLLEKHFQIRVCRNVKRDYRDAIDDPLPPEKRIKPDHMLVKTERESLPNKQVIADESDFPVVEEENEPLDVLIVEPELVEATPANNVVECVRSSPIEAAKLSPKFYLFQMPTMDKERNVLETIKLMGGKILNLESVYRVNERDNIGGGGGGDACP